LKDENVGLIAEYGLERFISYFNREWMRAPFMPMWNLSSLSIDDQRTNNNVEGWHRSFNQKFTYNFKQLFFSDIYNSNNMINI
jgi:hypothetical protein